MKEKKKFFEQGDNKMVANEFDYKRLYGNIDLISDDVVMAKCNCTKCNSCSCGRCDKCISQCTGCKKKYNSYEVEWEVA